MTKRTHTDYSAALIERLMVAYRSGHHAVFKESAAAKSWQIMAQKMCAAIVADDTAPAELRKAARAVAWGVPKKSASGWSVSGGVRQRRGYTAEELIAKMRDTVDSQ